MVEFTAACLDDSQAANDETDRPCRQAVRIGAAFPGGDDHRIQCQVWIGQGDKVECIRCVVRESSSGGCGRLGELLFRYRLTTASSCSLD